MDIDTGARALTFSQPGVTPSGQLSDPFTNMRLASQATLQQAQPSQAMERPPVPLFSQAMRMEDGGPQPSQLPSAAQPEMDMRCSQLSYLATPDFITPADQQFDVECERGTREVKHQRSPIQLSPNRIKRARKQNEGTQEGGSVRSQGAPALPGRAMAAGNPYAPGSGRRAITRIHSPPCYRSIFADQDAEQDYAGWRAPRLPPSHAAQLSRFRTDFKEIGMLGQGNYSKVFRVRHRLDGREYAVKRTVKEVDPDLPEFQLFVQEVQVLANLPPHPNLVQYFSSWTEPGADGGERLYMQLELCDVALSVHANLGGALPESDILEVLRHVAAGLAHLHAHGVAHMDLKPDNIYVLTPREGGGSGAAEGTQPAAPPHGSGRGGLLAPGSKFKVGDFGQATRMGGGAGVEVTEGDSRYLPLEVLNGDYSQLDKADMFALGASLYELAAGVELPQGGKAYQDLRHGKIPLVPAITTSLQTLIKSLMSQDPAARPSAAKVLQAGLLNRRPAAAAQQPSQRPGAATQPPTGQAAAEGRTYGGLVLQRSKG